MGRRPDRGPVRHQGRVKGAHASDTPQRHENVSQRRTRDLGRGRSSGSRGGKLPEPPGFCVRGGGGVTPKVSCACGVWGTPSGRRGPVPPWV